MFSAFICSGLAANPKGGFAKSRLRVGKPAFGRAKSRDNGEVTFHLEEVTRYIEDITRYLENVTRLLETSTCCLGATERHSEMQM